VLTLRQPVAARSRGVVSLSITYPAKLRCYAALALAAAILVFTSAAIAAPAIDAKTRTLEATVDIDPALERIGPLKEFLLNEAKRDVAAQQKEADEAKRAEPRAFRERWTFERRYKLVSQVAPYVSVLRTEMSYSGGAHPNTVLTTLIWDTAQGKAAGLDAFLNEISPDGPTLTALAALIRTSLAEEKRKRGIEVAADPASDEWLRAVEPRLDTLGSPALAPTNIEGKAAGFLFYFSPYDVGPYVEGAFTAFVPWDPLMPLLKADKTALFDGGPAPVASQN
jgi:hypothetical protein